MGDHNIRMGDKVLLERKVTKSNGPYDPDPYTVTQTHGTQITATREGASKTRDSQKWKKVVVVKKRDYDGYLWDSVKMTCSLPPEKLDTIKYFCREVLKK